MGDGIVIGISGVSRSGKGWVSKGLLQALEAMGKKATIIGQEDFWFQACQVDIRGQKRKSDEEPECTDHERFAMIIKENTNTHDVVVAEGAYLVYNPRVKSLLKHIFLLELDVDEARRRRVNQPRDPKLNPNPLKPDDFDDLLWPAYERYLEHKVAPLGARITRLQSPEDAAQRDELVQRMINAAGLMKSLPGNDSVEPAANEDTSTTDSMERRLEALEKLKLEWHATVDEGISAVNELVKQHTASSTMRKRAEV